MDFGLASYSVGFMAGMLSTLSPCVLPIVPILLSSAATVHRMAPFALAAGLALSYAVVGSLLAWAGATLAVDTSVFRIAGALMLGALGLIMMSPGLQQRFARASSAAGEAGNDLLANLRLEGIGGQFAIGLVLGVVWTPCVGPTLGAAILLASQGTHLPLVALMMGLFGLGAALPLVLLSLISRAALMRLRGRLIDLGKTGKVVLGAVMFALAAVILTGLDKKSEAWMVDRSPPWLTNLTTRF